MSELRAVRGSRPLLHSPHLLWVGSHLSLLHDVAEEFHGGGVEHALLGLNEEPVFQQSSGGRVQCVPWSGRGGGRDGTGVAP